MGEKLTVQAIAIVWAMVGFTVAAVALPRASDDARVLLGVASVVFPLSALLAALAVGRDRPRVAGGLLLLSVATPTYFAWVLNVPALVVGVALLVAPRWTVKGEPEPLVPR